MVLKGLILLWKSVVVFRGLILDNFTSGKVWWSCSNGAMKLMLVMMLCCPCQHQYYDAGSNSDTSIYARNNTTVLMPKQYGDLSITCNTDNRNDTIMPVSTMP